MKARRISIAVTILLSFALWEIAHWSGGMGGRLPSMVHVAEAVVQRDFLVALGPAMWHTGRMLIMALGIGTVIGYILGLLIGSRPNALHGPYHVTNALRSVPVTVLLPILLATFGLRRFFLPMLLLPVTCIMASNVAEAVRNRSRQRRALLELYRVKWLPYYTHVLAYETIEPVIATLRVVAPLALAIEIAVDYFLQSNQGLGTFIALAYQYPGREPQMFGAILAVAMLGILLVAGVDSIGTRTLRWKRDM